MDILIKNIELPLEERIQLSIYPNGIVVNHSTLKIEKNRTTAIELPPHGDLKDMADIWDTIHKFFRGDCFEVCKLIRKFCPTIVEASNGTDN